MENSGKKLSQFYIQYNEIFLKHTTQIYKLFIYIYIMSKSMHENHIHQLQDINSEKGGKEEKKSERY